MSHTMGGKGTSRVWVRVYVRIPMGYPCLTLVLMSIKLNRSIYRGNLGRNGKRIITWNNHWRRRRRRRNIEMQKLYQRCNSLVRSSMCLGAV